MLVIFLKKNWRMSVLDASFGLLMTRHGLQSRGGGPLAYVWWLVRVTLVVA